MLLLIIFYYNIYIYKGCNFVLLIALKFLIAYKYFNILGQRQGGKSFHRVKTALGPRVHV